MSHVLVILSIVLGTLAMTGMSVLRRQVMKKGEFSSLQFSQWYFGGATFVFALVYIIIWGFTIPEMRPGIWLAVTAGAIFNVGIQFLAVKTASMAKGEVSLTALISAMTPGLVSFFAITLGEYPSRIGVMGIISIMLGSYVLLWDKTPERWYEYFGPLKRLLLLLNLRNLSSEEREKTIVVSLSFLAALLGTGGLFFDAQFTRLSVSPQGLMLSSMVFTSILFLVFTIAYRVRPDATETQKNYGIVWKAFKTPVLAMGVMWVLHVVLIWPAYNSMFVSYVGALKRLAVLFTVIAGGKLFKEEDFTKRLIASILIVIGAVLIGFDDLPSRISSHIGWFGL